MNKSVLTVLSGFAGAVIGAGAVEKTKSEKMKKIQSLSDKHLALFLMMNQWVRIKQEGKNLASYFEKNKYERIAVYGMSYAGETLLEELKNTNIQVVYGIDQKADSIYADVDIVAVEDDLDEVDVIVVSAITFFDEIKQKLHSKINCPIISLEDILYEI